MNLVKPDSSRYTPVVLAQGLEEPMGMQILPGSNNVLFAERKGGVQLYISDRNELKTIAHFNVFSGIEDGLLGVALDPKFAINNWVYFYYSVAGDKWVNRLSRFELKGEELVLSSEKILLEIPTQRKYCCHSAGAIAFGPGDLLYLATGDNTNAEEAESYVPVDERPGHELADDQATAANSNDLRGKILRIKPQANGSYTIPEENLFPKDGSKGRPEIFVMGCRNPYRITVDQKTGFLYWGDVGPFTKVPGEEGTLSYDEINQAKQAGFYGWPYFLGNNEAFPHYDFATKKEGSKKDPLKPVNNSPNNTGVKELPPAQPAMIWYGRLPSKRFPLVGKGGASAMTGPVFYADQYPGSKYKLSDYYNGKLFIYDWVRRWIMAVSLDKEGNYQSMEPFLQHLKLAAPIDMKIAPDGALYILEYGTNWFSKNADARLVRIEYSEGNRNPVAKISADKLYGATPLTVNVSAKGSKDYDQGDKLSYEWQANQKKQTDSTAVFTFDKPGVYDIVLTVRDNNGGSTSALLQVKAGNTPPEVNIHSKSNKSFYWDNAAFDYTIEVKDAEDKQINDSSISISFNYIEHRKDPAAALSGEGASKGSKLIQGLDCKSCHAISDISVGPSYKAVATRYHKQPGALAQLTEKIIKGGSGNWGTREMLPHPELPENDAREIVQYILALANEKPKPPASGKFKLDKHAGKGIEGGYLLTAAYKDNGANSIEPLTTRQTLMLRDPLIQIEDFDAGNLRIGTITTAFISYARAKHEGYARFDKIDLTQVGKIKFRVQSNGVGGRVELRIDSLHGPVISSATVPGGEIKDLKTGWKDVDARLVNTNGIHDLYLVFVNDTEKQKILFNIDWIRFAR